MSLPDEQFESEMRLSARPVIALLGFASMVVHFVGNLMPRETLLLEFGLGLQWLAVAAWLVNDWNSLAGRWFTTAALVGAVQVAGLWLDPRLVLALRAIPVAVGAAVLGVNAAAVTACVETVLLLFVGGQAGAAVDLAVFGVGLTAVWMPVATIYGVFRPIRRLAEWAWDRYERALDLLEQARDRQVELRQAVDDLAHTNRQLTLLNEKVAALRMVAEQAEKSKAAFLARVSHEFRTPLNMIIGLSDLLVEAPEVYGQPLPPTLLEHLEIVHRNCKHLSSMIDDVLDLSQIEAGRMAFHRDWVDLEALIRSTLTVVTPLIRRKSLDLEVQIPPDLPDVYCDRTRILQVIVNLLSNAARFTERGGITLSVVQEDGRIVVSVSDTGPGISPEDAAVIFEPFCQGVSANRRDKGGTGLGLTISKEFVELHGGRMWLESELGAGSTFFFRLPVVGAVELGSTAHRWISGSWVERRPRAKVTPARLDQRVVICDETGEMYTLFRRYVDRVDYVDTRSLPQAIRAVRECPPEALVINCPSPGGLLTLVAVAKQEVPDTPIIGCCVSPSTQRAMAAGAISYLVKPIDRKKLEAAIASIGSPVRRILVVDDEPDACMLLSMLLKTLNQSFEVTAAFSGEEGLAMLRSERPDLVLLDVFMPEMDGWQVLATMNQDDDLNRIPVIFVSAQDPKDEPMVSWMVVATMGEGLSFEMLLTCSQQLPRLLATPSSERAPDPR